MFTPGQLVVYPAQGVGVIECIESQELGGVLAEFYIVRIADNNITVMVPVKSAANTGLRRLSSKNEAKTVLAYLQDYEGVTVHVGQNWNRRQREYTERLKAGGLQDIACVLRELILISASKELSFGEKRLLEQAMTLLSIELSYVLEKKAEDIKEQVESYYAEILTPPDEASVVG